MENTLFIKDQFHSWLKELTRWGKLEDFIHWREEIFIGSSYKARCNVYTHTYVYTITVHVTADKRIREGAPITESHDYMGCTMSTRKPRAGEDWTRGNDLPDGKFTEKTWKQIKNAIIKNELVKICKPIRRIPDTIENK